MALATAMYYSERNPLKRLSYKSEKMFVAKDIDQRRLQKAFLRYHDEKGWDKLRQSLRQMGHDEFIGQGVNALVPEENQRRGSNRPNPQQTRAQKARGGKLGFSKPRPKR